MHVSDERTMKRSALERGIEQGKRESAIESAKNLLKMKLGSIKQIAQAVGLSVAEVQKLAAQ